MDRKAIGERLRALRGDRTLRQVASDVGISLAAICMYEAGERLPRPGVMVKLANYYNTTVEALFFA